MAKKITKEITIEDLVNRVHCWKEVYVRHIRWFLSDHERDEFEKRQDEFAVFMIQVLEGKMGTVAKLNKGEKV